MSAKQLRESALHPLEYPAVSPPRQVYAVLAKGGRSTKPLFLEASHEISGVLQHVLVNLLVQGSILRDPSATVMSDQALWSGVFLGGCGGQNGVSILPENDPKPLAPLIGGRSTTQTASLAAASAVALPLRRAASLMLLRSTLGPLL
eukprot:3088444-Amphidinium_carterae.1